MPDRIDTRHFTYGQHVIMVSGRHLKWTVAVDGAPLRSWHSSAAAAWAAGVREVDRLDGIERVTLRAAVAP